MEATANDDMEEGDAGDSHDFLAKRRAAQQRKKRQRSRDKVNKIQSSSARGRIDSFFLPTPRATQPCEATLVRESPRPCALIPRLACSAGPLRTRAIPHTPLQPVKCPRSCARARCCRWRPSSSSGAGRASPTSMASSTARARAAMPPSRLWQSSAPRATVIPATRAHARLRRPWRRRRSQWGLRRMCVYICTYKSAVITPVSAVIPLMYISKKWLSFRALGTRPPFVL